MCHPETCTCNAYTVEYLEEGIRYGDKDGWYRLGIGGDDYDYILYRLRQDYPNAQIID